MQRLRERSGAQVKTFYSIRAAHRRHSRGHGYGAAPDPQTAPNNKQVGKGKALNGALSSMCAIGKHRTYCRSITCGCECHGRTA